MFILALKPLKKLTGTLRQTGGQTDREADTQEHKLSQADALSKISRFSIDNPDNLSSINVGTYKAVLQNISWLQPNRLQGC